MDPCIFILSFSCFVLAQGIAPASGSKLYTKQERKLIPRLRERVRANLTQPIMFENSYLVRFLRAKDHDLDEAEEFIRRNLKWRQEMNMDKIFEEDWSEWLARHPFSFGISDYEGHPAIVSRAGTINIRRIALAGKRNKLDRYFTYGYERSLYNVLQVGKKLGKEIIDGHLLINMYGYTARTHACLACVPVWINLVLNYERYYPQLGVKLIIVNAPRVFQALFATLKPLLSYQSVSDFYIYDLNIAQWKYELFKIFPEEVLTPEFGGKGPPLKPIKSIHDQDIQSIIFYNQTAL